MVIKIKNILVPIDGSKNSLRGLDEAITLARNCQAAITGVHVLNMPPGYVLNKIKADKNLKGYAKNLMEAAKTKCARHGIYFKYFVIPGSDAGYDIIRFSKKHRVDMIIIGARGLGGIKKMFLGSVSNYVVHKSKIPVMIVK